MLPVGLLLLLLTGLCLFLLALASQQVRLAEPVCWACVGALRLLSTSQAPATTSEKITDPLSVLKPHLHTPFQNFARNLFGMCAAGWVSTILVGESDINASSDCAKAWTYHAASCWSRRSGELQAVQKHNRPLLRQLPSRLSKPGPKHQSLADQQDQSSPLRS